MKEQHKLTRKNFPKEIQREKKRKKKTPKRKEEKVLKKEFKKNRKWDDHESRGKMWLLKDIKKKKIKN
jgi:hypothetical protein